MLPPSPHPSQCKASVFIWDFKVLFFIKCSSFYEKGSEAIDWLIANGYATTRQEGILIGQVCKLHSNVKFKNSYYYGAIDYRSETCTSCYAKEPY